MNTPTWQPSSGPPPAKATKAQARSKPQVSWGAPTMLPVSLAPPVIKTPYSGVAVVRSTYVCSPREGTDTLTNCGRLLFLPAITVSANPDEVTCVFCRMRLPRKVELRWHYGPTTDDPDPGKMWHYDCGGEVWYIEDGSICCKCGQQEDNA